MDIEFKKGVVCFAFDHQWKIGDKIGDGNGGVRSVDVGVVKSMIGKPDFQLNTIKQGDYIEASELDTERKYNNAVEVFELFSNKDCISRDSFHGCDFLLVDLHGDICGCSDGHFEAKRKLTYSQLMAIGELKRLEIERDKSDDTADKGTSTDEELRVAREHFSKTGTIDGNLLRKHTMTWPDDFIPKDGKYVVNGKDVSVKWGVGKKDTQAKIEEKWQPSVGDNVSLRYKYDSKQVMHTGKILYLSEGHIILLKGGYDMHLHRCEWIIEKPKTPEEILHDELVVMRNRMEERFIDELLKNFKLIRKEVV